MSTPMEATRSSLPPSAFNCPLTVMEMRKENRCVVRQLMTYTAEGALKTFKAMGRPSIQIMGDSIFWIEAENGEILGTAHGDESAELTRPIKSGEKFILGCNYAGAK